MQEVFGHLKTIPELKAKMSKLSEANMVHSQYAAAMDNLRHIFNITSTVEMTHEYIMEGNLLHAHKKQVLRVFRFTGFLNSGV